MKQISSNETLKESQLVKGETVGYFTSVAEDENFAQPRTYPASGQDGIQLYSGLLDFKFSALTTRQQLPLHQVVLSNEPIEES